MIEYAESEDLKIAALNKDVIRSMIAAIERDGFTAQAEYFAEGTMNHGVRVTRDDIRAVLQDIATTFPDVKLEPLEITAEADWVIVRCYMTGTHLGMGQHPFVHEGLLAGVTPTGRRVHVQHIHMFRLQDGLVVEHWACRDDVDMMRQLGLPLRVAEA